MTAPQERYDDDPLNKEGEEEVVAMPLDLHFALTCLSVLAVIFGISILAEKIFGIR